jgi:vang-like
MDQFNQFSLISYRFYDELDYERRVRKRRTKLLSSCEDAFTHVRKCLHEKYNSHVPMDAREAAQVIIYS